VVFRCLSLELLLELVVNLVFAGIDLLNLASNHNRLTRELLMQLLNFVIHVTCTRFLIHTCVTGVSCGLQLIYESVSLLLSFIDLLLLRQQLITKLGSMNYRQSGPWVSIFDLKAVDAAILASCKKPVIVKVQPHAAHWSTVNFNFSIGLIQGQSPYLKRAWVSLFAKTCEQSSSTG